MREDVTAGLAVSRPLNGRVGGDLKPIAVDGVLEYMEPTKRVQFLNDWKKRLKR